MARLANKGLEYTSLDVAFFQDRKVRRLQRRVDSYAPLVYLALLCSIFKEGYYIRWDDDVALDLADNAHLDEKYVSKVIEGCLEVGLLSREMFSTYGILTSAGIQKQYERICEKSKRKSRVDEYSLLNTSEEITPNTGNDDISSEEKAISSEVIANPSEVIPQSKVKESKEKESNYSSLSSFLLHAKQAEGSEEEQEEQIVSFFTFERNYKNPNAEYQRMVLYNTTPSVPKKWSEMSLAEKAAVVQLWHPKEESVESHQFRHSAAFLSAWKRVYGKMCELGATHAVKMAALSDELSCAIAEKKLYLTCPVALYDWIEKPTAEDKEANLRYIKPILWPFMQQNGAIQLKYNII